MKYNKLAVVVSSLLLVSAGVNAAEIYNKDGNKLDLYGKVDARHQFSDDKGADGDQTYVRLGFRGETQINSLMTGYGQWEYNIQGNTTESEPSSATRLAFAGMRVGDYGSFDYGRNYGVNYDVEAWTDILPVFGGDSYTRTDNFMTSRGNGMATYRNNGFFGLVDGLNVAAQYQGKNESERKLEKQNGDGYGLSTTYEIDGFAIGGSYANSDRTDAQIKAHSGKRAEAWNVGLKYDANNIYLATTYAETRNMTAYGNGVGDVPFIADKTQNIEAVAQYQFDFGLRPSLAYVQSKGKHLNTGKSSEDLVKYIEVGSTYYFNKNMATYVDYKINLLDDNDLGIKTDNVVGVGMVYQF